MKPPIFTSDRATRGGRLVRPFILAAAMIAAPATYYLTAAPPANSTTFAAVTPEIVQEDREFLRQQATKETTPETPTTQSAPPAGTMPPVVTEPAGGGAPPLVGSIPAAHPAPEKTRVSKTEAPERRESVNRAETLPPIASKTTRTKTAKREVEAPVTREPIATRETAIPNEAPVSTTRRRTSTTAQTTVLPERRFPAEDEVYNMRKFSSSESKVRRSERVNTTRTDDSGMVVAEGPAVSQQVETQVETAPRKHGFFHRLFNGKHQHHDDDDD